MELISKSARESERSLGVEHDDDEPSFFVGRSRIGVDFVLENVGVSLLLLLLELIGIVSRYHFASPLEKFVFEYFFFNVDDEDDFDFLE